VFDPLAIALVLAANQSKDWDEETEEIKKIDTFFNNGKKISQHLDKNEKVVEDESILQKHPYLTKKFENFKNWFPPRFIQKKVNLILFVTWCEIDTKSINLFLYFK
jgi:hypothetical protein